MKMPLIEFQATWGRTFHVLGPQIIGFKPRRFFKGVIVLLSSGQSFATRELDTAKMKKLLNNVWTQ
jgi:hypothetical protein